MRNSGYSLLELLVTAAIVSILLAVGLPALRGVALDARQTADLNAFVTAVALARSEAVKRALPVILCPTENGTDCAEGRKDYTTGWIVRIEAGPGEDIGPARDEAVLMSYRPAGTSSIRSNRNRFRFRPYYRRSTNGTVTFCDSRGNSAARAVILSYTGRPRTVRQSGSRQRLLCET